MGAIEGCVTGANPKSSSSSIDGSIRPNYPHQHHMNGGSNGNSGSQGQVGTAETQPSIVEYEKVVKNP